MSVYFCDLLENTRSSNYFQRLLYIYAILFASGLYFFLTSCVYNAFKVSKTNDNFSKKRHKRINGIVDYVLPLANKQKYFFLQLVLHNLITCNMLNINTKDQLTLLCGAPTQSAHPNHSISFLITLKW